MLNGPYDDNPSGGPGLRPMFDGFGHGAMRQTLAGVPHFREVDFYGRFPTADLVFKDERFPGDVRMTAFSPFIPHNDRDSSMPVAMFAVRDRTTRPARRSTTRSPARSGTTATTPATTPSRAQDGVSTSP